MALALEQHQSMDVVTAEDEPQQQHQWRIGQIVDVQPRTWAGINRQGGTGKIIAIHNNGNLDVKYILSGFDKNLQAHLVSPHAALERTTRRREPEQRESSPVKPAVVKKTKPRPKKKMVKAPPSVQSIPTARSSACSSTVSYIPKEIAVPLALSADSQDKPPPIFSPLTYEEGQTRRSWASGGSLSAGPPSVIEECCLEEPATQEPPQASTTTEKSSMETRNCLQDESPMDMSNNDGTTHKLRRVFDQDRKQASQFIDAVVTTNQELNCFSSLLNTALLQNDGALEVSSIGQMIDGDYSTEQIQHYVQQLCAQNKIMRTDDIIYSM